MASQERLYLIDGHALAYRTYFALTRAGDSSRWFTKKGEPTAGTYGFASVLMRLLEQETPEYLAVSFDTGRTFRDDLYAEYKATREKMPEDLIPQIERIRQLVRVFGIPILEAEGFEADDVLGTVARRARALDLHVIILTGDRDLLQLAEEGVTIRLAGQKLSEAVDYGPKEVQERFGLSPSQLVDYKALIGDTSDNIPGVHGIGEKTATSLLGQFKSLDAIYAHLQDIPERVRSRLEAGRDSAYLSRQLGTIHCDVPIDVDIASCRVRPFRREQVAELFRDLEFRSLLVRLETEEKPPAGRQLDLFASEERPTASGPLTATIINEPEALERLTRRLTDARQIALDVETTSTDPLRAQLVGISLAVDENEGFYLPVGHHMAHAGAPQLPMEVVLEALRPTLTQSSKPKVGHNLKYDYAVLANYGLLPTPLTFDTMLAEWLCDPGSRNLGLKSLAWVRLGLEMTTIEELIGQGARQRSMAEVPIARVAPYAAADAAVCLRLMPVLEKEIEEKRQLGLLRDLEMPLVEILAEMERVGVALDIQFLQELSLSLAERASALEAEIFEIVGRPFNINSTQQLSSALFKDLGLTPPGRTRRTASGHYSTAADVLEELRRTHPVVERILQHREITKLKSTYAEALPLQVNPRTGRVHTSYNQTGTVTGRIASSEPNLQNIPIRTELGRQIRRAFIAASGSVLLSVDYSQIELRIVAHMAEDQAMLQAFRDDQDIHATTAAAVFGTAVDAVTPEMRRRAKAVNFGLIYGMSPFGLSKTTDLTLGEAEEFVRVYFRTFPGVRSFLDRTRQQASEQGFVETLLGRRRYFPQLVRGSGAVAEAARSRAEREAINAPIQGSAADIIKLAMLRLPHRLRQDGLEIPMLLQVHDELVFECPQAALRRAASAIQDVMQNAYRLAIPLKTDAKYGPNWAEMSPLR